MKRAIKMRQNQRRRQHRQVQAMHNSEYCVHGFNRACLLCGFGEQDGQRVWADWTRQRD